MKPSEFASYKARYRSAIRKVLAESEPGRLDEAGFPAYSHPNPVINWLFWQRLRAAMEYIEACGPHGAILDFGCGSGVMLPFLSQHSRQLIALDVDLVPLERVREHIPLAGNVKALNASIVSLSELEPRSFDVVNALDVLEHVDDLPGTLKALITLLRPGGRLVVSGPTENVLYRIGRRLAGPEYSGAYHERGVGEIRRELAKHAPLEAIATLYQPLPLFEIFAAVLPPRT